MKHLLTAAVTLASLGAVAAHAEVDFYGKANVSFELVSEGSEDFTELDSNASRLGVKGSQKLTDALSAIYQMEYQVDIDKDDDVFSQRNIYVGLKGDFGSVIAGYFDTPFKKVQGKVDLFNDLHGDIKYVISKSEKRKSNSLMYVSPKLLDSVSIYVDYISTENEALDPGVSAAVTYTAGDLYLAAAVDSDVVDQGTQAARLVAQYTIGDFTGGLLVEQYEGALTEKETGWMASLKWAVNEKWVAKAQVGASEISFVGGEVANIGADYKIGKNVKLMGFYSWQSADNDALDNDYLGTGIEVKF